MERTYRCVAHGTVPSQRIESYLVADRGDGVRGSTTRLDQGKRAVTHVEAERALRHATLCAVRLETGKTHQIRVHAAYAGHPVAGDDKYGDFALNRRVARATSPSTQSMIRLSCSSTAPRSSHQKVPPANAHADAIPTTKEITVMVLGVSPRESASRVRGFEALRTTKVE
jgi:23S rRNA-/tRNA-specific pseudouridylate synthase